MNFIPWRNKRSEAGGDLFPNAELRSEVERLFDVYLREPFERVGRSVGSLTPWNPPVEITEDDRELLLRAELPGIEPNDLDIQVTGNQLVLAGEKRECTERKDADCYHSERRYGTFRRVIPLPTGVDAEQVTADYDRGVLTIRLPKTSGIQPKQIRVRSSETNRPASE